jgi:hypothetical protein
MARAKDQTTQGDICYFSDSEELGRKLRIWRRKVSACIVVVLVVLGFSAKPAYRAFREYRIQRNLEAAKAAARTEDWGTARDKAYSVLIVRPDFDAFRIWTRALGKLGEPRTFTAVVELFTDSRATREDRLEALRVMVLQAPQAVALSAYDILPKELRDQASFRAAIIPLLIQRGEIDVAERGLREVAQPGDEPKVQLEILRTLCSRPQAARVAEARRIFAELLVGKADEEALAALLILGDTPGGLAAGKPLPDLTEWLKCQPKATAIHHLLGMHPALEAQPEAADRLYQTAIARFGATDPGVLGTWLIRHGKAAKAATLLEEPAQTRSDAYLARLRALLRLQQESDIVAALAKPPVSVDPVELEILQATFALQRSDPTAAEAAWTRALNRAACDNSRNRFIEIARAAESLGAKDAVENAWVAAMRLGWGPLPLYRDLCPVVASLAAKGRSEDLLALYQALLRFEPLNPEVLSNFYYLALIHASLSPAEVVTALVELAAQQDKPEYQATLMLAEMLAGRPADALARLPQVRNGKGVAPMMLAALEGSARVLGGETEAGAVLLGQVDWSGFMRQERLVFRDLLVKLKLSGLPLLELASPEVGADPAEMPAWRKAVQRLEKDQAGDVLPALPAPRVPAADWPTMPPAENLKK